jgi:hypothetical protein
MDGGQNDDPPNDRAAEIADMLTIPPLGLEGLFADPSVRYRIGESISHAMLRPIRGSRKQPAMDVRRRVVKVRTQDR